mmetsp:Transcript_1636/g.3693  ORF Transcript_1636/g.3693 Transcript_1636/m.3693 type:complete len:378 (+) Transcript_1636:447-1580(+)
MTTNAPTRVSPSTVRNQREAEVEAEAESTEEVTTPTANNFAGTTNTGGGAVEAAATTNTAGGAAAPPAPAATTTRNHVAALNAHGTAVSDASMPCAEVAAEITSDRPTPVSPSTINMARRSGNNASGADRPAVSPRVEHRIPAAAKGKLLKFKVVYSREEAEVQIASFGDDAQDDVNKLCHDAGIDFAGPSKALMNIDEGGMYTLSIYRIDNLDEANAVWNKISVVLDETYGVLQKRLRYEYPNNIRKAMEEHRSTPSEQIFPLALAHSERVPGRSWKDGFDSHRKVIQIESQHGENVKKRAWNYVSKQMFGNNNSIINESKFHTLCENIKAKFYRKDEMNKMVQAVLIDPVLQEWFEKNPQYDEAINRRGRKRGRK